MDIREKGLYLGLAGKLPFFQGTATSKSAEKSENLNHLGPSIMHGGQFKTMKDKSSRNVSLITPKTTGAQANKLKLIF